VFHTCDLPLTVTGSVLHRDRTRFADIPGNELFQSADDALSAFPNETA